MVPHEQLLGGNEPFNLISSSKNQSQTQLILKLLELHN